MTDTYGDVFETSDLVVQTLDTKTNTSIAKGQVCVFTTDGMAPCAAATTAGTKAYMCLDDITAIAATRQKARFVMHGLCRVKKKTGAGGSYAGVVPTFQDNGELSSGGNAVGNMTTILENDGAATYYEVFIS